MPSVSTPPVRSLSDEAAALTAAVSGWLANRGLPGLAAPCALLAEHLSGGHPLRDRSCPSCSITDPAGPHAATLGHVHDAVRAFRAAATSTRS